MLTAERAARLQFPEYRPLPLSPEPGGWIPFRDSIDGEHIGRLAVGSPDEWPLILTPRNYEQGPPLSGSLAGTLPEWLSGRLADHSLRCSGDVFARHTDGCGNCQTLLSPSAHG